MVVKWKMEDVIWGGREEGNLFYLPSSPSRCCICIMQWLSLPKHVPLCPGHSRRIHGLWKEPCRSDSGYVEEVVSHRAWQGDEWEDRVLWWLQGIYRLAYHDWVIDENQSFPLGPLGLALRPASFVVVVALVIVGGPPPSPWIWFKTKKEDGSCWSNVKNWWWRYGTFFFLFFSTGVCVSVWDWCESSFEENVMGTWRLCCKCIEQERMALTNSTPALISYRSQLDSGGFCQKADLMVEGQKRGASLGDKKI